MTLETLALIALIHSEVEEVKSRLNFDHHACNSHGGSRASSKYYFPHDISGVSVDDLGRPIRTRKSGIEAERSRY